MVKLDIKALIVALIVSSIAAGLVFLGSRDLQNFDPALIAYLFGTLFALFGITYRYTVWIQRPPTRLYFVRSFQLLFSKRFFYYLGYVTKRFVQNIGFQRFIYPRGKKRWLAHFLIAFGCIMAFAITIPLTFGWIHFTLEPDTGLDPEVVKLYNAHFFGFKVMQFKLGSVLAYLIFHALNWCSLLIIAGCIFFLIKRFTQGGLISIIIADHRIGNWSGSHARLSIHERDGF